MAKIKNKSSAKSLVMVLVTGITLVAVTLCWFAIADKSNVNSIDSVIENDSSSKTRILCGVVDSTTQKIAITSDEVSAYVPIEGEAITLENMIPGAEYFYRVDFSNCKTGQKIDFSLEFANTSSPLFQKISVSRLVMKTDNAIYTSSGQNVTSLANTANVFSVNISEDGNYSFYFSFKFADEATHELYANQSVTIKNVSVVLNSEEVS